MGRLQHELGLVEQLRAQCQVERHREPLGGTVNGEGAGAARRSEPGQSPLKT